MKSFKILVEDCNPEFTEFLSAVTPGETILVIEYFPQPVDTKPQVQPEDIILTPQKRGPKPRVNHQEVLADWYNSDGDSLMVVAARWGISKQHLCELLKRHPQPHLKSKK